MYYNEVTTSIVCAIALFCSAVTVNASQGPNDLTMVTCVSSLAMTVAGYLAWKSANPTVVLGIVCAVLLGFVAIATWQDRRAVYVDMGTDMNADDEDED